MSLNDLANLCERLSSIRSKNEKVSLLARYLNELDDQSIRIACTFLSNRVFPKGSELDLNLGYSNIWSILEEISIEDHRLKQEYLRYGDLGKVTEIALKNLNVRPLFSIDLTLTYLYESFVKIARIRGPNAIEEKRKILKGLLINSSPLEGKYLVKIILKELRIGLEEGLLEAAIASAFSKELEEIRRGVLLNGDIGYVALLAKHSKLDTLKIEVSKPISFMLADTISDLKDIDGEVIIEYKYDGMRAQLHKGYDVRIFSRSLEDITNSFPNIVREVSKLEGDIILDGELVAFIDSKVSFNELQKRLKRKNPTEDDNVMYIAYDILYLNGSMLIDKSLRERRAILNTLKLKEPLMLAPYELTSNKEEIAKIFEESRVMGHEGLMLKDPESPYQIGKRGRYWLKYKHSKDTLDVVIVAAEYGHGKRAGLLSDYTFAVRDDDSLKVIGKAYSGLSDEEIRDMTARLKELIIKDEGYRIIVRPEIVLEVAFDSIGISDRYDSNFALRFPRIKRIRLDKSLDDIDTLDRVKAIYAKQ